MVIAMILLGFMQAHYLIDIKQKRRAKIRGRAEGLLPAPRARYPRQFLVRCPCQHLRFWIPISTCVLASQLCNCLMADSPNAIGFYSHIVQIYDQ